MTRGWKFVVAFLFAVNAAFVAEHVWLFTRPSPPTIDPDIVSCRLVKGT